MKQGFFSKGDRTVVITELPEGYQARLFVEGAFERERTSPTTRTFKEALREAERMLQHQGAGALQG